MRKVTKTTICDRCERTVTENEKDEAWLSVSEIELKVDLCPQCVRELEQALNEYGRNLSQIVLYSLVGALSQQKIHQFRMGRRLK